LRDIEQKITLIEQAEASSAFEQSLNKKTLAKLMADRERIMSDP
jgi:hypothetical protein